MWCNNNSFSSCGTLSKSCLPIGDGDSEAVIGLRRLSRLLPDRRPDENRQLSLGHAYLQGSRIWGHGGENVVGCYGSANALKFKLPNRLDRDGIFDRHQDTRADQNLTGLGFVAQPGCNVGHRPDGGIVETSLEANGTERGISVRNADAEADLVAQLTPFPSQSRQSPRAFPEPSAQPGALGYRPEWDH